MIVSFLWTTFLLLFSPVTARPVVRNIRSAHEFDRLLQKHATETGLPVVVDFYSDSCGPCRMMAPIFKKVAAELQGKAVFCKVDTNAQHELSSRYQIRSLPTFAWFLGGKKVKQEVGGIGEAGLRQHTDQVLRQAETENIVLPLDSLLAYYQTVDATKARAEIESVYQKCVDKMGQCVGSTASQLVRKLRKKYKSAPKTQPRFTPQEEKDPQEQQEQPPKSSSSKKSNLQYATKAELEAELERRLDQERDAQVESEDANEDEANPDFAPWSPSPFPERMVVIGGGPAGLAAAIYGARAGLQPLVICPSMGGQLQGKGVDVENYPGLSNVTGPAVVASMRLQAAHFGAFFEDDAVVKVDASSRPLKVHGNATGVIETHTIVVATGAEANWLGVPGEWELRGGGVSSCATCDGFLYANKHVLVVGGGDAAMEDALVLARTSKKVTLVHRRETFRASKVLADRVMNHPTIAIRWNMTVQEIVGKQIQNDGEEVDLDHVDKVVAGALLRDVSTGETVRVDCDAVFVAIGHTPSTSFLKGVVEFDTDHPGYVQTLGTTTQTSEPGIFAAGDVADSVYRQAITSAGSGAAAALDAERYLSEHGLGNEAAEFEAELLAEMMGSNQEARGGGDAYNAYEEAGGRMAGMKESLAGEL